MYTFMDTFDNHTRHVKNNNDYNDAAVDYNHRLELHYGRNNIPGNFKYMRLVNPYTGTVVNNNRRDTPASNAEINRMTMLQWDAVAAHYRWNWTLHNLNERRGSYRAHLGLGM